MTTACTLVKNLPDVITESDENVGLPPMLEQKWRKEGSYEKKCLNWMYFSWKLDFRGAKILHYEMACWLYRKIWNRWLQNRHPETHQWRRLERFQKVCDLAFAEYKLNNPKKILDNSPFFTIGELYGYGISQKRLYDFGDKKSIITKTDWIL